MGALLTLAAALTAGCGSRSTASLPVLARSCLPIGGAQQERTLTLIAPAAGLLQVTLDLSGIAVVAHIDSPARRSSWSASPIERLGRITLVREVVGSQAVPLRISSVDSREVTGEVCVGARVLPQADAALARAASELAAAGAAFYGRDWQRAFDDYSAGARILDGLSLDADAAAARHAMAQLAYGPLLRKRDAVALTALTLVHEQDPVLRGARYMLMATALMELPENARAPTPTTRALLEAAAGAFRGSSAGRRELPRLAILAGFEQYEALHTEEARRLWESATNDCRDLHDWQCFARGRQNLAALAEEQQDYPSALSSYEDALRLLDSARMPQLFADISGNLGRLDSRVGLIKPSEEALATAMQLYAQVGDCDGARRSAGSLGALLVNVGNPGDAESYLRQVSVLGCAQLIGSLAHGPAGELGAGWQAPLRPRTEPVCSGLLPAGALTGDASITVFGALVARSNIALLEDDLLSAARCLAAASAYALEPRMQVWLATASGGLRIAQGRFAAARSEYTRALQIADRAGLPLLSEYRGEAEIGLAHAALLAGDATGARMHAYAALNLSAERADVGQLVGALRQLSGAFRALNDSASALRTLRLAVRLMERVPTEGLDADQRATYLATQHDVFAELTDLLISTQPTPEPHVLWDAFNASEEGRARALRYALSQLRTSRAATPIQVQSSDYRALLRQIADTTRKRDAVPDPGNAAAGAIDQLMANGDSSGTRSVDDGQITRLLAGSGSSLIEYAVGHSDMFAFVIDAHQIRVVTLGRTETIAQAAASLLQRLREDEPETARIQDAARQLAQLIWWPLKAYVTQRRVVIVPDDALNTVPFAVLPWSELPATELLLQHAELTSLPSAELLVQEGGHREPSPTDRFVLLGDPVFRSTVWQRDCADGSALEPALQAAFDSQRLLPSLPGTRDEVEAVASIVRSARPSARIEKLTHCSATVAGLRSKSPQAQLLHIATHGLVDARRPRLSSLVLTPNAAHPDETAYRLLDIVSSPLQSRLVVLSACDTSNGRLLAGEGVLGLTQAFLQAGADSVVASYWRVPDGATAPFMDRFYRYLLGLHLPVAAALRRAQLDALAQGNPYAWAAFGLYGRADSQL